MSKRDIADKRQTLPEGRISLTEAVTWLAYGKLRNRDRIRRIERFCEIDMNARNITKDEMVKRSNKGYPKRTREEKFEKIRNRINEAFSILLPKLQADKIQAFGVLVDKYHWEQMPKTIAAVPSKIDIAVFSKTTVFRYGADAIDWVLGKEGGDERDRLWKRGVAESYSGFIAIEVNAAELAREFAAVPLTSATAPPPLDDLPPMGSARLRDNGASTARTAYEARVAEFRLAGNSPPSQTTKRGILGDREWAVQYGVSRVEIKKWRDELVGPVKPGRPADNSAGNSAGE